MSEDNLKSEVDLKAEWLKIRQQFAGPQQSVGEGKEIELIQMWIQNTHPSEFQQYSLELKEKGWESISLKSIIGDVLTAEKDSHYLITQRYTFQKAQELVEKVREKCKKTIQELSNKQKSKDVQSEEHPKLTRQQSLGQKSDKVEPNSPGKLSMVTNQFQQITKQAPSVPIHLPNIRKKGKVYNPQQMANYFHLSQQSFQDYNFKSPHMFQTKKKIQVSNKTKIFNNKYLKMAFERFSRQAYSVRGTFSEVLMEGEKMNLNKWMVFCKEFDFTQKFHAKHLIQVYQQGTKFATTMDLDQFLTAVTLLQQKYLDKFHTGQNFVDQVLKINSQAAFKVKMSNLKVQYGGNQRNFFQFATYPENIRKDILEREKQYKKQKKEHQLVLINGMYEDHLKAEIQKRKEIREKIRESRVNMAINRSMTGTNKISHKASSLPQSPKTAKKDSMGYSKIFHIKQQTARKTATNASMTQSPNTTHMYKTQKRSDNKQPIVQAPQQSRTNYQVSKINKSIKEEPKRQWMTQSNNPSIWLSKIRNDSQESDDILRQHMQLQKKIQQKRESMKNNSWMTQIQKQSKKVSEYKQQMQQDEEEEQMIETGANFNLKTKNGHLH